jgi:hypothetical protein
MGKSDYYADGEWNTICDMCGFKYKSSQIKKQWDGVMACRKCWRPRQPQDFVRGTKDQQRVSWTRDEAPDAFTADATALTVPPMTYG